AVPLVGRLFRRKRRRSLSRPAGGTPPRPKKPGKDCEQLESRCVVDNPFATPQAAFLGAGAFASLAFAYPTPEQVLLQGWGLASPGFDLAPIPQTDTLRPDWQPDPGYVSYVDYEVAPRRDDDRGGAGAEDRPIQAEYVPQQPERLVLATPA